MIYKNIKRYTTRKPNGKIVKNVCSKCGRTTLQKITIKVLKG